MRDGNFRDSLDMNGWGWRYKKLYLKNNIDCKNLKKVGLW